MQTLDLKRGDTLRMVWQFRDENGDPVDLTGVAARFRATDGESDITASTADGRLTIDELAGDVMITVPAAITASLDPGLFRGDLELTFTDGTVLSTDTLTIRVQHDYAEAL